MWIAALALDQFGRKMAAPYDIIFAQTLGVSSVDIGFFSSIGIIARTRARIDLCYSHSIVAGGLLEIS